MGFYDEFSSKTAFPIIKLYIDDEDYSVFLVDIPEISIASSLGSNSAVVRLSNADGTFNSMLVDYFSLTKKLRISITFTGYSQELDIFEGFIREVYTSAKKEIELRAYDRFFDFFTKEVGSGSLEITEFSTGMTPASLAWYVLTLFGGLDYTPNSSNIDIDYSSWEQWRDDCEARGFRLGARFSGQTIQQILSELAEITGSKIWNDSKKIKFWLISPPSTTAQFSFNTSNILDYSVALTLDNLVNRCGALYYWDVYTVEEEQYVRYIANSFAFEPGYPDRIFDLQEKFVERGFTPGMILMVDGRTPNQGVYEIAGVTPGALTLTTNGVLVDEDVNPDRFIMLTGTNCGIMIYDEKRVSQELWGLSARSYDGKLIWHDSVNSARTFLHDTLDRYAFPYQVLRLRVGLIGLLVKIGDTIAFTEPSIGFYDKKFRVLDISGIRLDQGTVDLICARW